MKRRMSAAVLAVSCLASGSVASQTPGNDELVAALSNCMTMKTSGQDRLTTARWTIVALAQAPQLSDAVVVDPAKKDAADREMAALFTRLLTKDCAAQSRNLFKTGDRAGFEAAGRVLGEIAMRELTTNPKANESMMAFAAYINEADFKAVVE